MANLASLNLKITMDESCESMELQKVLMEDGNSAQSNCKMC